MVHAVMLEMTGTTLRYVVRATVPAVLQVKFANAEAVSAYPGIDAQDLADLKAGVIAERTGTIDVGAATVVQMRNSVEKIQVAFQAELTADARWKRYGSFWVKGQGWTAAGVN